MASIEQVLAPLRIALTEHAHQVAAGMQAEWARLPGQAHAGLFGRPAAFAVVAGMAARNQVLPGGFACARTRHDMIQRELR